MAEELHIPAAASRAEKYAALLPQIKTLTDGETDLYANLANTAAALKQTFDFFWIGFYLVKGDELVLGPFQGPVACTRISRGKGVCGSSWARKETLLVPDVDLFPGHIACSSASSSASRSEIVVPGFKEGEVTMVLDVDSDKLNDFGKTDQQYLEQLMRLVEKWS